jgi:hypothetical protein
MAQKLMRLSYAGSTLNTSNTLRRNGTIRSRLASLTRKCRHAASKRATLPAFMYLIGSTYNFCVAHQELSKSENNAGLGFPCTPALASGITDHMWSVKELLTYKIPPPPLPLPKKRGRPCTKLMQHAPVHKKPVVRLRKGALCAPTGYCGSVRRVTRFSYPQLSWEECGRIFLDHHTYLKSKGGGDYSMCEKRWCSEDV